MAKRKAPKTSSKTWGAMSMASGLLAATVARRVLTTGWKAATGKEPPANPADPDVAFREAVVWAGVSGTLVALARMLAGRRAAHYYVRSTGHLPPELESDAVREARLAEFEATKRADEEASALSAKASHTKRRRGDRG